MSHYPIEELRIDDLKSDPKNAFEHSDQEIQRLVGVMGENGFLQPVVVNRASMQIIGGHARVEAAKANGFDTVPAVLVDFDEQKAKAVALSLNSPYGHWDDDQLEATLKELEAEGFDLELTGLPPTDIESILANDKQGMSDPDDVPEPPAEPITQRGDLIELGPHRLLCGDATSREDVDRLMGGKQAQCVFTSPPYAVGVDYGESYKDDIESLRAMLPLLARIWNDLVVDGGYVVINFGDVAAGKAIAGTDEPCEYPMALEYWPIFRAQGMSLWSRRIWCKPNPRVHSLQCINSNRAATDWEHIWTWKVPGKSRLGRVDGKSALGWIDTTHESGVEVGKETHGAGMAILVAIRMVEIHSRARESVLEPFAGTGTTLIAAEMTGRICCATELSPTYCDVIIQRWESFTGKQAIRPERVAA